MVDTGPPSGNAEVHTVFNLANLRKLVNREDDIIKWFLETLGNAGLCKLLDGYDDRSARAEVD